MRFSKNFKEKTNIQNFLLILSLCVIITALVYPSFGSAYQITIRNPIQANNVPELIKSLTNWLLGVAGSIMLIVLIFAGFRYMTAGSNEEKAKKAKDMLKWTIIGIAITIGAAAIVNGLLAALGAVEP